MKINYLVKTAKISDIYNHLMRASNDFDPCLDSYVNIKDYSIKIFENAITFEAWFGEELIGLAAAYYNNYTERFSFLTNLSVESNFQGLGIAKNLIISVINYAENSNYAKIFLEVKKNNHKVINFYIINKFTFCGENKDSFIMEYNV